MSINASTKGGAGSIAPFFNEPKDPGQYFAGKYYYPSVNFSGTQAGSIGANYIYFLPFVPKYDHTFLGIGFQNTSAADTGDKFRLGVYADDGQGNPGSLILDAGEVTLDASAALRIIAISQTLAVNTIYWLAIVSDNTTGLVMAENTAAVPYTIGTTLPAYGLNDFRTSALDFQRTLMMAHAYAALPATAAITQATGNIPMIYLEA